MLRTEKGWSGWLALGAPVRVPVIAERERWGCGESTERWKHGPTSDRAFSHPGRSRGCFDRLACLGKGICSLSRLGIPRERCRVFISELHLVRLPFQIGITTVPAVDCTEQLRHKGLRTITILSIIPFRHYTGVGEIVLNL